MDSPSNTSGKKHVVVVGAGPAGLAAAEVLASAGVAVTIHDRMPNPARKFLLAGRGGLNLTHSEPIDIFLSRYGSARAHLEPAIRAFPPEALRHWSAELGLETFVGSSGRVFPKTMKASPLLRAWLTRLDGLGVKLAARSRWIGWDGDRLVFETGGAHQASESDAAIFALGGASWPRLGSDGSWRGAFEQRGAWTAPLRPSNSGFLVSWSDLFRDKFAGQPLKAAGFLFNPDGTGASIRGEAMITREGIEGGAIYALSSSLREFIARTGRAFVSIDLAPNLSVEDLEQRLAIDPKASSANRLRKAGLSPVAASLLREGAGGPKLPAEPQALARLIKGVNIRLSGTAPIERAISTAGGIGWNSIEADYSLKADPRTFVCGEMLDWEAPTGGYLLQACFATGRAAAQGALARLSDQKP